MKTIALEEHFATKSFLKATGADGDDTPPWMKALQPKLLDLGAGRIAAMDEGGIDFQVLSLMSIGLDELSAADSTALATEVNDELAAAVRAHPERLGGFATLAMKDPEQAAKELERCVTKLGFKGVMLDGTIDGSFFDDGKFLPVFEAASQLKVPVYLHPAPPPKTVREAYFAGLPEAAGQMLSIAGRGWHAETGLHTLRLIVSGLFDKLPDLQLVIGHMGEGLPYALTRSSSALSRATQLRQTVAEYFQTNIHVTTSGYFTLPPLRCAIEVLGIDRMMYSVDYPFSPNTNGKHYLDEVARVLSAGDLEKLAYGNAARLLKI